MVSAGVSNALLSGSVDSSAKVSSGEKTKDSSSDFTKIFDKHTNDSTSKKNDELSTKMSKKDEMKEIIQKNFSNESKTVKDASKMADDVKDEILSDSVTALVKNVIEVISNELNVSEEEIVNAVEELGISVKDLTDKSGINQIVSDITGFESMMDILTNEDLSSAIKDIYAQVDSLFENFSKEISVLGEDFNEIIQNANMKDILVASELIVDEKAMIDTSKDMDEDKNLNATAESTEDFEVQTNSELEVDKNYSDGNYAQNETHNEGQSREQDNLNNSSRTTFEQKTSSNEKGEEKIIAGEGLDNVLNAIKDNLTEQLGIEDESVANRIVRQITDEIKMHVNSNTTSLEIQLEPETLGRVSLTVASKAGTVTAQLTVQNEVARAAIESQMAELKENLNNQGLKVEAIEVTIASHEFEENLDRGKDSSNQGNGSKKRRRISEEELAQINGIETADDETEEIIKEMGNTTVSYMA